MVFDELVEVYNALRDDESKQIFEKRVLSNATRDTKYIHELALQADITATGEKIRNVYKKEMYKYETNTRKKVLKLLSDELEKSQIVVCGAAGRGEGKKGIKYLEQLRDLILCDKKAEQEELYVDGVRVLSTQEAVNKYPRALYVIFSKINYNVMKNELIEMGICEQNIVLLDTSSGKEILNKIGHTYAANLTCDNLHEETYFDKKIMIPEDGEIMVDCGFYDGLSSRQFMKWCSEKYKKIIAFEPDSINYQNALKIDDIPNLELFNAGCWSENTTLCFAGGKGSASQISADGEEKIKVLKIDDVLKGEPCTFIKMDIEGAELEALKGAEETIRKYHPKLAISIYHKPEDIYELPKYILELCPDYKLYLRHYSFGRWDTVLYAVEESGPK